MNPLAHSSRRSSKRLDRKLIALVALLGLSVPALADASEMAALAVEIGRTAVAMHHHAINPRRVQPTRVIINHQGDVCHFEAVMVWTSGTFGAQLGHTPRRAVIYGSLINRSDIRRLYDLEYVEAPDRPCIGCDQSPKVITYWNTVFARLDTLSPARELGQPLHRSMHPLPACENCPPADFLPPAPQHAARPFPTEGEEVLEGQALAAAIGEKSPVVLAGAESSDRDSWFTMPRIRTGRKPGTVTPASETALTPPEKSR